MRQRIMVVVVCMMAACGGPGKFVRQQNVLWMTKCRLGVVGLNSLQIHLSWYTFDKQNTGTVEKQ